MTAFRFVLGAAWLCVAAITIHAILALGLPAALATFIGDLGHAWRAQFYADLEVHLLLVVVWILYRESSRGAAILYSVATMLLGALFTLPYLLVASIRAKGDVGALLLGARGASHRAGIG